MSLAVDWTYKRQVAPSLASWNWFCLPYLSCGLATQEKGGSFLSQLEQVLLMGTLVVDWLRSRQVAPTLASWNQFGFGTF